MQNVAGKRRAYGGKLNGERETCVLSGKRKEEESGGIEFSVGRPVVFLRASPHLLSFFLPPEVAG